MYVKGMLTNPGMGPNTTINRWIEQILMFQFKIKHVRGLTFSPDGLSRRRKQEGDPEYLNPEVGYDDNPPPEDHEDWEKDIPQPWDFEDFKAKIDVRGGYAQEIVDLPTFGDLPEVATSIDEFQCECEIAYHKQIKVDEEAIERAYKAEGLVMPQFIMSQGEIALSRSCVV
ncbi:hypothetical protein B0H16DRAFT_1745403 [Mycena metata]|uniref:Uncharacterized protein n=1 Tax=Mycena metata TaxID=1033252 RepID=A0AAD7H324_9AGAR|nr:hypothetical protein B0H16DRAFT_1745403 [Mycena metata]